MKKKFSPSSKNPLFVHFFWNFRLSDPQTPTFLFIFAETFALRASSHRDLSIAVVFSIERFLKGSVSEPQTQPRQPFSVMFGDTFFRHFDISDWVYDISLVFLYAKSYSYHIYIIYTSYIHHIYIIYTSYIHHIYIICSRWSMVNGGWYGPILAI